MTETALDLAHAKMEATPEEDAGRLAYFERLSDSELFILLAQEAEGDDLNPDVFEVQGTQMVLVFDREERLADFVDGSAPYAATSGRTIVAMLRGKGVGIGVNFGASSAMILPEDAIEWLAGTLGHGPAETEATPTEFTTPAGLPEILVMALDSKLATAAGLASGAYLAGVTYDTGQNIHILAFVDAKVGAETALAAAVNEALTFSGIEAGSLDVAFLKATDPSSAQLARVGLRFDLPELHEPKPIGASGTDPNKPPKLR